MNPFWRARPKKLARALLSATLFIALTVAGFEGAARLLLPDQVAEWRRIQTEGKEIYFYTPGVLRNTATYPTYKPNTAIRLQAYFPDPPGTLTKEYDCAFHSDELGYVANNKDYEDSEILVLGDSFTVGNGGCNWTSRLAADVRARLYIAAHPGYGALHWRAVIADLAKIKTPPKILMIAISDDMARSGWTYTQATLSCLNLTRHCDDQIILPATKNLAEVVAKRSLPKPASLRSTIKHYFPATAALYRTIAIRNPVPDEIVDESIAAIRKSAEQYDLKLLWVTEKRESAGPTAMTKKLAAGLSGLDVTRCQIPAANFMPRDYHPNPQGYDILKDCVERLVRNWAPATVRAARAP